MPQKNIQTASAYYKGTGNWKEGEVSVDLTTLHR